MKNTPITRSQPHTKLAGALYLVIAVIGGFSIGYMPSVIVVPNDALATSQNLAQNMGLFQTGIFADILVILAEIVLTALLFHLLAPVNKTLSTIAAYSRLSMVVVMGMNLLNYVIPLLILSQNDAQSAFDPIQRNAIALLFFDAHQYGVYIWQIFFAAHLLALGYLVTKSKYLPKILGIMMFIGSFGYLIEALTKLTNFEHAFISAGIIGLLVIVTLAELAFAFWLLIKGVDLKIWNAQTVDQQGHTA